MFQISCDHIYPNIYVLVHGHKKWKLISPQYWSKMYLFPALHPSDRQSQINFTDSLENQQLFTKFYESNIEITEFELHAGDILYVPPFWFHQVMTVSNWRIIVIFINK